MALVGWDKFSAGSSVDDDTTRDLDPSIAGGSYGGGTGLDLAQGRALAVVANVGLRF